MTLDALREALEEHHDTVCRSDDSSGYCDCFERLVQGVKGEGLFFPPTEYTCEEAKQLLVETPTEYMMRMLYYQGIRGFVDEVEMIKGFEARLEGA